VTECGDFELLVWRQVVKSRDGKWGLGRWGGSELGDFERSRDVEVKIERDRDRERRHCSMLAKALFPFPLAE
jgi:hypothetical protein